MSKEKNIANINNNSKKDNSFLLSSWDYGSFLKTNPIFLKNNHPVKNILKENEIPEIDKKKSYENLNKYGKRKLSESEKIVTDDLVKLIKDLKIIKGNPKINNTKSFSKNLKNNKKSKNFYNSDNIEYLTIPSKFTNDFDSKKENYNNSSKCSSKSNDKFYKFSLTFDEWKQNKNKQLNISEKLKKEKFGKLKQYELIENTINQKYNKIKYIFKFFIFKLERKILING